MKDTAAHDVALAYSPVVIGPLTLRNRFVKSATNEGMSPNGVPSRQLVQFHADMAAGATTAKKQKLGWLAYVRPIIRSISENRQQEMSFTLDEKNEVKFKAHTAIVGNCGTLTANLLLMPDAILDDGLLNIVVLNPRYFSGWTRIWSRLAIGGALNKSRAGRVILNLAPAIKTLRYDEMKTLKLKLKRPQNVQLDGDSFGEVTEFDVTVLPHAISIRVSG